MAEASAQAARAASAVAVPRRLTRRLRSSGGPSAAHASCPRALTRRVWRAPDLAHADTASVLVSATSAYYYYISCDINRVPADGTRIATVEFIKLCHVFLREGKVKQLCIGLDSLRSG